MKSKFSIDVEVVVCLNKSELNDLATKGINVASNHAILVILKIRS